MSDFLPHAPNPEPEFEPIPGWGPLAVPPPPVWPDYGQAMGVDPGPPVPRWGMPDILIGLLAFLVASVVFSIPVIMLTDSKGLLSIFGLIGSWIGMVGYLWLISRKKGSGTFKEDFGFRFRWFDPLLGFVVGFGTIFLAQIVSNMVASLFDADRGSNAERVFSDKSSAAIVVITALLASIGAPIVEELFFRGLAFRSIKRRLGPAAGIIGSSLVFGLLHWQPGSLGSTLSLVSAITVFGLVFGLLTQWQDRLGPSICAHMTINGLASAALVYSYFSHTTLT